MKIIEMDPKNEKHITELGFIFLEYVQHYYDNNVPVYDWNRVGRIINAAVEGTQRFWFLIDDETVVGFCGLTKDNELAPTWIRKEYRGLGWGKKFLDLRMKRGGNWMIVMNRNIEQMKRAKKAGFVVQKVEEAAGLKFTTWIKE